MSRQKTAKKPGWEMSESQWFSFWRMWKQVCVAQGWDRLSNKEVDEKRREILAELGFASAKDIDMTKGFDKVKRRFEELMGKVHVDGEEAGDQRRLLARIGETMADLNEAGYEYSKVKSILKDFRVIEGQRDISDLSPQAMLTLSRTLTRVLNNLKRTERVSVESS